MIGVRTGIALVLFLAPAAATAETVLIDAARDTTLIEDPDGALANGSGPVFFAGRTNQGQNSVRRGLVFFDVAAVVPGNASVESVRVRRRADGWVAEVTTLRRKKRTAYSRITGGTGDPGLSRLRLLFSNGMGRDLNLGTSIELLDTGGDNPSTDFNFWGRVEWLPGGGDAGLELHWVSEKMERTVYEPVDLTRTELFLRGKGNLGDHLSRGGIIDIAGGGGGAGLPGSANQGWHAAGGWFCGCCHVGTSRVIAVI